MRNWKMAGYILGLVFFAGSQSSLVLAKKFDLKTDLQKVSYGIGQQIGQGLKTQFKDQGIEIDLDILSESLKANVAGEPSQLNESEMQAAFQNMQGIIKDKMKEVAEKNKKEGSDYLAMNKKKPNVKTTESGLQYIVEKEGSGASPSSDSKVKVHYAGTLLDGTEFDSSYKKNEPAVFPVGGVIKGWTEALKMMKPGAKWQLTIPSELAYGSRGRPGIPGNSVLKFQVELLEVLKAEKTPEKK